MAAIIAAELAATGSAETSLFQTFVAGKIGQLPTGGGVVAAVGRTDGVARAVAVAGGVVAGVAVAPAVPGGGEVRVAAGVAA